MQQTEEYLCVSIIVSQHSVENYLQCLHKCLVLGGSCQGLTYYSDFSCMLSNETGVESNCAASGAKTYVSAPKLPLGESTILWPSNSETCFGVERDVHVDN